MIEMPSVPEPPTLEPEQIKGLISYAENMAAFLQAEMELIHELGRSTAESDLNERIEGWKFTAQGLRDSYDGQY